MNMTILTTDSIPMIGGVADYLHNLCIELSKYVNITVYTTVPLKHESDANQPYPMYHIPETRHLGDRFGDGFPVFRKLNTLIWYLNRPYEADKLLKKVSDENRPHLVIIPRWEERAHFWCQACRKSDIPYMLIAHGLELVEEKSSYWKRKRQQDISKAKFLIANSSATKKILRNFDLNEKQIHLFSPGIRKEKLESLPLKIFDEISSNLRISRERYILSLCRLVKRKGIDLAIRAFSDIADKFPNFIFIIAGNGPELSNLRSLADELGLDNRIRFLGEIDDLTKRALFQGCEFFVMPNRPISGDMEGFGIVFLEAAMFGKAVIGGNNGGVPDAVIDGKTGLLVDTSGSHQLVKDAMTELLSDPMKAQELGKAGEERAIREFSWEKIGRKFTQIL